MDRAFLAACLALSLLLAGCAGSSPQATSPSPSTTPVTAETGAIEVRVLDDEEVPVAGASVAADGPEKAEGVSDEAGRLVLPDLAPGTYRLVFAKLGFQSTARSVAVRASESTPVDVRLKPLPDVTEPMILRMEHQGFIQCGVNAYYPTNYCGEAVGQDKAKFPFEVLENVTFEEAIFELVWTPATAATGQELEMDVCERQTSPNAANCVVDGDYYKWTSGPSPQTMRLRDLPLDQTRLFEVDVGSGFLSPYPTLQQSFTLYVSLCYALPCADNYTAVPPS